MTNGDLMTIEAVWWVALAHRKGSEYRKKAVRELRRIAEVLRGEDDLLRRIKSAN